VSTHHARICRHAGTDRLEINRLEGIDTEDSTGLGAGAIELFVDGALIP
jgi:hypothetical protein